MGAIPATAHYIPGKRTDTGARPPGQRTLYISSLFLTNKGNTAVFSAANAYRSSANAGAPRYGTLQILRLPYPHFAPPQPTRQAQFEFQIPGISAFPEN